MHKLVFSNLKKLFAAALSFFGLQGVLIGCNAHSQSVAQSGEQTTQPQEAAQADEIPQPTTPASKSCENDSECFCENDSECFSKRVDDYCVNFPEEDREDCKSFHLSHGYFPSSKRLREARLMAAQSRWLQRFKDMRQDERSETILAKIRQIESKEASKGLSVEGLEELNTLLDNIQKLSSRLVDLTLIEQCARVDPDDAQSRLKSPLDTQEFYGCVDLAVANMIVDALKNGKATLSHGVAAYCKSMKNKACDILAGNEGYRMSDQHAIKECYVDHFESSSFEESFTECIKMYKIDLDRQRGTIKYGMPVNYVDLPDSECIGESGV